MRSPRPSLDRPRRLISDRRGATAIEYGLIMALVAIAIIASLKTLATTTGGVWNNTSSAVQNVSPQ